MRTLTSIRILNLFNANFIKWCAGFWVLIIIQISVLKYLALVVSPNSVVKPDLVLISLFFYGIRHSQLSSTLTGFTAGFFLDAFSGGILGLHALTKTVAGFLIGYVPRVHKIRKVFRFCVLYFIINITHDLLYNVIYIIDTEFSIWRLFFVYSLPSSVYSVFIGGIVFYWLKR